MIPVEGAQGSECRELPGLAEGLVWKGQWHTAVPAGQLGKQRTFIQLSARFSLVVVTLMFA